MHIVYSTLPNIESARKIASTLVQYKLAACVNILPQIESIYEWQGKIESGNEVVIICKTLAHKSQELMDTLSTEHPYDAPAIFTINCDKVEDTFAEWLKKTLP